MKHILSLTLLSVHLMLAACDNASVSNHTNNTNDATTQTASDNMRNHLPTYLVGSEINYEPFSFKDQNGQPSGFEIDLLKAIGQEAGFNVQFVHAPRSEVANTLNNDRYKIWASTLSITPERSEQMDFSQPYLDFVREIYLLNKPENASIKTIEDFKGKKIAINRGSKSAYDAAVEITGSADNVVQVNSFYLSLKEIYSGKATGTLGDSRILQYYKLKHPEIPTRTIPVGDKKKDIAFAVKKGNTKLLNQINAGLEKIKANGTYDYLLEKWFGKSEQN